MGEDSSRRTAHNGRRKEKKRPLSIRKGKHAQDHIDRTAAASGQVMFAVNVNYIFFSYS